MELIRNIENLFSHLIPSMRPTALDELTKEYLQYFDNLFGRAGNTSGFDYICTLLRVEGITSGHWDAFVEAEEAAKDFSKLLRKYHREKYQKRSIRLGLFIYCHLTEMSAPYEILANLLRCIQGQPYSTFPFSNLVKVEGNKKSLFAKRILPSPRKKIMHLKELAEKCNEQKLVQMFDNFFRNDLRNAFYHSDYAISEEKFRIIEGGQIGKEEISLEEVSTILMRCFAFYSAFFICYNNVKRGLVQGKKFQRWPNYEVFEFLSEGGELTGFKIHFPNGTYAMFERKKYHGTTGLNFMCRNEGIELFIGDLEKYRNATDWFVDGKPFEKYGTRYNTYGYWRPIVFQRDSQRIQSMIQEDTTDKVVQGILFYIYTTGHRAIEFVIKSNLPLFSGKEYTLPHFGRAKHIVIKVCETKNDKSFIYDGTLFLDSKDVNAIQGALNEINDLMGKFSSRKGLEIRHRLKYQLYRDFSLDPPEQNDNGTFTISLKMDDPRSTLVASNLGIFPKTDWRIKSEWI